MACGRAADCGEEAAATVDGALVETFELWGQYEAQLGQHTSRDDAGAGQPGGTGSGG
jgi:hypothetical protein